MGSEENRITLAKLYFKKAKADLESANQLLTVGHYANTVFMAQQSAEKAAKAVLALKGVDIREHIVSGFLASEILTFAPERWDERLRVVIRNLVSLEEHTIRPRYPIVTPARIWDPEEGYDRIAAEDAVNKCKQIMNMLIQYSKESFGFSLGC